MPLKRVICLLSEELNHKPKPMSLPEVPSLYLLEPASQLERRVSVMEPCHLVLHLVSEDKYSTRWLWTFPGHSVSRQILEPMQCCHMTSSAPPSTRCHLPCAVAHSVAICLGLNECTSEDAVQYASYMDN